MIKTEVLVIGSGLAGGIAALTAAENGKKVTLITKSDNTMSGNTPKAQGGIIYKCEDDNPDNLFDDIINAGGEHCWKPAVKQLCEKGPDLVKKLLIEKLKVDFDKNSNGKFDLTSEAAHSIKRIIHQKDQTGLGIQKKLLNILENSPNVSILNNHTAIDLLTLSHHSLDSRDIYKKPACFGAIIMDNTTGEVKQIFSNRTILATGGMGYIYLHTTNQPEARGDSVAMAWRAGARCFNLQFMQFHPTTLFHESGRFLLTEALRGEGAKLIDVSGNEFMEQFHKQGSLAPRDIVARGIHQIMLDSDHPCVYLDISHKDSEWIQDRFPSIFKHCSEIGIDITSEPVPVVPAAHYACGGIGVNLWGRTSLKRLYAVGEGSCTGVHGANRLASTSLLECVVWGYIAGNDVAKLRDGDDYFPDTEEWKPETEIVDPALIAQDWLTIKNTMWNYVGLIRTRQRLLRAATILRHLQTEIEQFYQKAKLTDEIIGLRNGVQAAIAVTSATLETRQSQGTHYLVNE